MACLGIGELGAHSLRVHFQVLDLFHRLLVLHFLRGQGLLQIVDLRGLHGQVLLCLQERGRGLVLILHHPLVLLLDGLVLDLILPKLGVILVKFLRVEANHVPQDVQVAAGLAQLVLLVEQGLQSRFRHRLHFLLEVLGLLDKLLVDREVGVRLPDPHRLLQLLDPSVRFEQRDRFLLKLAQKVSLLALAFLESLLGLVSAEGHLGYLDFHLLNGFPALVQLRLHLVGLRHKVVQLLLLGLEIDSVSLPLPLESLLLLLEFRGFLHHDGLLGLQIVLKLPKAPVELSDGPLLVVDLVQGRLNLDLVGLGRAFLVLHLLLDFRDQNLLPVQLKELLRDLLLIRLDGLAKGDHLVIPLLGTQMLRLVLLELDNGVTRCGDLVLELADLGLPLRAGLLQAIVLGLEVRVGPLLLPDGLREGVLVLGRDVALLLKLLHGLPGVRGELRLRPRKGFHLLLVVRHDTLEALPFLLESGLPLG